MGVSTFDATMAVIKGFRVLGTSTSTRAEANEALRVAANSGIRPVVEIRGMADIERTMQDLKKGSIKGRVVIDLDR
jgi:D-arabinose 1-dehydrogenase-like Zn-dependent alcohol dehydrogenase